MRIHAETVHVAQGQVTSAMGFTEKMTLNPSMSEISVTFDEEMMDQNWSWAYTNKNEFPKMKGQPYYTENYVKNVLPVILEPNKEYIIWLNSEKFKASKTRMEIL